MARPDPTVPEMMTGGHLTAPMALVDAAGPAVPLDRLSPLAAVATSGR